MAAEHVATSGALTKALVATVVEQLRETAGRFVPGANSSATNELRDDAIAAADEIEVLRAEVRRFQAWIHAATTSADREADCEWLCPKVCAGPCQGVALVPSHDFRRARGAIPWTGEPAEQTIRRLRDGDQP